MVTFYQNISIDVSERKLSKNRSRPKTAISRVKTKQFNHNKSKFSTNNSSKGKFLVNNCFRKSRKF